MATRTTPQQTAEAIFEFIGRREGTWPADLASFLGVDTFAADIWMKTQAVRGVLHRDASGAYGTSCPWPRAENARAA